MRVLICGDRKWSAVEREGDVIKRPLHNYAKIMYKAMKTLTPEDEVIEGEAAGADVMSRIICDLRDIPYIPVPADWCDFNGTCQKKHDHRGRVAGTYRNKEMLAVGGRAPDEVWAFHEDITNSKGTIHMIRIAWAAGITVKLFSSKHPSGVVVTSAADFPRL